MLRKILTGAYQDRIRTRIVPCFVFSCLFAGSMAAGVQLEQYGNVDFSDISLYAGVLAEAAALTLPVAWAVCRLEDISGNKLQTEDCGKNCLAWHKLSGRSFFFLVWGILLVCYLITLISVWPGFFCYDAETQVYMVFTSKYSAHHPVLHVLLLGWTIRFFYWLTGSYNIGIAVYLIMQMLVLSACFSYMISFLRKSGARRFIVNGSILFMGLFPTVQMFVCSSTKDTYFTGGVVLFTVLMLEFVRDGEMFWNRKRNRLLAVLSILMILFFRNNGIYALVIYLVFFAVAYRSLWKKWLFTILLSFLIFGAGTAGMNAAFHVEKGEIGEMLCIPMQQLARVYNQNRESFNEEDLEILYSLIPASILEQYSPKLADKVKVNFLEDNFKANPKIYISLWARTGWKNPAIYVNAFLQNSYGYWYPDTVLDGYRGRWIVDREYKDNSYFAFTTEMPGQRRHFLPALERLYEKISLEIYVQKFPVISMLFSIGFLHWVYAFLFLYLWLIGKKRHAGAMGLIGLLYLTVLPGPIALVRYVLYFYFCLPLAVALLLDGSFVEKR